MVDETISIHELVGAYAVAVDHRDGASFIGLWAEGGALTIFQDGPDQPQTNTFSMPTEVSRFIESLNQWDRLLHMLSTKHMAIFGDEATGEVYCEAHYIRDSVDLTMAVRYNDDYRRIEGSWLFSRRAVSVMWTSERPVIVTG